MNENYDTTYFSKSQHEIPWLFPDINPFSEFPWHYFKFPDNSLTLKKIFFPDFSLTRGNPVNNNTHTKAQNVIVHQCPKFNNS